MLQQKRDASFAQLQEQLMRPMARTVHSTALVRGDSLLEALATAVAMAWAVALATAVEAAEASALPKEP